MTLHSKYRDLNVLNVHKSYTIKCLQIFRTHANFTYLFLKKKKKCYSELVILFFNVHSVLECLFLFRSVIPPTADLPNSISTPWVASWRKTQHILAMEANS